MALETEHRGYTIRYSENGDEWTSYDAGTGMSAPTLSKLKEKIDRMIAAQKKKTAVEFLVIEEAISGKRQTLLIDAKATGYAGPKIESLNIYSSTQKVVKGHKVEAVYVGRSWGASNTKAARRVIDIEKCCPDTDATRAAVAEANRLGKLVEEAERAHRDAIKAIPRLTLSDIEELVKLSGIDPTGGLPAEK